MRWIADDGTVHEEILHFQKSTDEYGDLGNMTGGFMLRVNGLAIRTPEALYQACRFPLEPTWQRDIIDQHSPMMCKRLAHKGGRKEQTRPDWTQINVDIMRWVLRVKLCLHFDRMGPLLRGTGERPLVERSRRDTFWGAVETDSETLTGTNRLGLLWMELRAEMRIRPEKDFFTVLPLEIPDFLLDGKPIGIVRRP